MKSNWAWAAGLFDGEGHISCRDRTGNGHLPKFKSTRTIVLTINQHHREVLERFQTVTADRGHIYTLTKTRPSHSTLTGQYFSYAWRTGKRENILYIVESMWPWLGSVKRTQAAKSILLHTSLDPHRQQVNPDYILNYYNDDRVDGGIIV